MGNWSRQTTPHLRDERRGHYQLHGKSWEYRQEDIVALQGIAWKLYDKDDRIGDPMQSLFPGNFAETYAREMLLKVSWDDYITTQEPREHMR